MSTISFQMPTEFKPLTEISPPPHLKSAPAGRIFSKSWECVPSPSTEALSRVLLLIVEQCTQYRSFSVSPVESASSAPLRHRNQSHRNHPNPYSIRSFSVPCQYPHSQPFFLYPFSRTSLREYGLIVASFLFCISVVTIWHNRLK